MKPLHCAVEFIPLVTVRNNAPVFYRLVGDVFRRLLLYYPFVGEYYDGIFFREMTGYGVWCGEIFDAQGGRDVGYPVFAKYPVCF